MNIYSDAIEQLGIFTIVGGILAIVATVLAYVFIVPEKRREKLNAFGKFLHDTCNFKYLIVEGSTAQLLRQALSNHPSGRKP